MIMDVSVIIPCLNESKTIKECISKISYELDSIYLEYEIIVVDNGSNDGSDIIAKKYFAKVIYSNSLTVAGVRNDGFSIARGTFIIFMDADIIVTESWGCKVKNVFENMKISDNYITGSHPLVPKNMNPVLSAWYIGISKDIRNTHLGTGHMLLSRDNFIRVGKFNDALTSGEDFDFCQRAKKIGINIISDPTLKVYHLGYPNNVIGFVKRELWHGEGDCISLKKTFYSPVALVGIMFLVFHILFFVFIGLNIYLLKVTLLLIILCVIVVNYYKFSYGNFIEFIKRSLVTYVYLLCRGMAFLFVYSKRFYRNLKSIFNKICVV